MFRRSKAGIVAVTAALILGSQVSIPAHAQEHEHEHFAHPGGGPRGEPHGPVLDSRYNHGHYYPGVGASVRVLPEGYRPYFYSGHPYYFASGVWYAPGAAGFVVIHPPVGVFISVLPPYYSTVWIGGLPYYYANDVYYTWNPAQNGYVVVDAPPGADQPGASPAPPASAPDSLIVYPKNGQSSDQQAADRYECHRWAKQQTGFDPTAPAGGANPGARSSYDRAMSACLTGRGYEVK